MLDYIFAFYSSHEDCVDVLAKPVFITCIFFLKLKMPLDIHPWSPFQILNTLFNYVHNQNKLEKLLPY